jgi:hypothetical protein
MYFHALYTGTVPKYTSNGSLLFMKARVAPTGMTGESMFPHAGTMPFVSTSGVLAVSEAITSGTRQTGRGLSFPCGPHHAGEEVD